MEMLERNIQIVLNFILCYFMILIFMLFYGGNENSEIFMLFYGSIGFLFFLPIFGDHKVCHMLDKHAIT